jgi:hypothetical protein
MVGTSDAGNGLRDASTKNMRGFSKTTRENSTLGARYDVSDTRPRRRSYLKKIWKKVKNAMTW